MKPTGEIRPLEEVLKTLTPDELKYVRKVSAMGGSEEAMENAVAYAQDRHHLHGDSVNSSHVELEIKQQPIHHLMAYMLASGKTHKEIAECTGYTAHRVYMVAKLPWFRKLFLDIVREHGADAVESFVKGETIKSLETLVEIRDSGSAASVRLAAANSILDRALGKPTVMVKSDTALTLSNAATSKEEIERQLQATAEQLKARGLGPTPNARN